MSADEFVMMGTANATLYALVAGSKHTLLASPRAQRGVNIAGSSAVRREDVAVAGKASHMKMANPSIEQTSNRVARWAWSQRSWPRRLPAAHVKH
jgi:hypothetical protein